MAEVSVVFEVVCCFLTCWSSTVDLEEVGSGCCVKNVKNIYVSGNFEAISKLFLRRQKCKKINSKILIKIYINIYCIEHLKILIRKFPHYFALNNDTHTGMKHEETKTMNKNKSKSPNNNVANMYDELPRVIKEIEGYTSFVKALKLFLVEKCYCNVDDFNKEIWQSWCDIIVYHVNYLLYYHVFDLTVISAALFCLHDVRPAHICM